MNDNLFCKNCGQLLWREERREYLPNHKTEINFVWWHDWGEKGVFNTGKNGCKRPEPKKELI
jgi:hypothetical protein